MLEIYGQNPMFYSGWRTDQYALVHFFSFVWPATYPSWCHVTQNPKHKFHSLFISQMHYNKSTRDTLTHLQTILNYLSIQTTWLVHQLANNRSQFLFLKLTNHDHNRALMPLSTLSTSPTSSLVNTVPH